MANEKATPMNRADIINEVAAEMDIPQKQADEITRAYEAAIIRAVAGGQEVRLNNFGSFKVQDRAARTARNPQGGDDIQVPAKRVPKFGPSKAMKDAVAGTGSAVQVADSSTKDGKAAKSATAASDTAPTKAAAKKAPAKKK